MVNISKLKEYIDKGYIKRELSNWRATKDAPKEVKELLERINNKYKDFYK